MSPQVGLLTSPQGILLSLFWAIILGQSLIDYGELLFPPKLASLNFWALLIVYYGAFSAWFAVTTITRFRIYTDSALARFWLSLGILQLITYVALMRFASNVVDSFLMYMWGWVFVSFFMLSSNYFRQRDLHLPEPLRINALFFLLTVIAAVAYTIWDLAYISIPPVANWVFVFIAFANLVCYRQLLRLRHSCLNKLILR